MSLEKNKLYLDTSIPSAYFDNSKPVRQLITQKWFEHDACLYDLYVSVVVIQEIERFPNLEKREKIKELTFDYEMNVLDFPQQAMDLANEYMAKGAIPPSEPEDAYHIAIATMNRIEALASWNFKHIVSFNPIRKVHELNRKYGYPTLEIGSLELFGGAKYGNI
ncbi:MAG: type II toxin-antitoxin system VapC family toxin [bacterium]|nr:type II toxin-antitoxin system VapC family toxin [bacterium]